MWMHNKFVIIISIVLIACIGIVAYVCFDKFFGGNESTYGDRLVDIENYDFDETDITLYFDENALASSVRISGKIIYISIEFDEETSLNSAKKVATSSLEYIEEDLLGYYDINYTITSTQFTLMGYKNSTSSSIVWNNNTAFDEESE